MIRNFSKNPDSNISLHIVTGKTIKFTRADSIPVHNEATAIGIFDDHNEIIEKSILQITHMKKYNSLLESVLRTNGDTFDKQEMITAGQRSWNTYRNLRRQDIVTTKDFYLFLGLIEKIQTDIRRRQTPSAP